MDSELSQVLELHGLGDLKGLFLAHKIFNTNAARNVTDVQYEKMGVAIGQLATLKSVLKETSAKQTAREERIKGIIAGVRKGKACTTTNVQSQSTIASVAKRAKSRSATTDAQLIVRVGWLNRNKKGEYQQVRLSGAGARKVPFEGEEIEKITPQIILDKACRMFFPNGKCKFGDLSDMEVFLGNYNHEIIDSFKTLDGQPCSYLNHLREFGLYPSKVTFYVMTANKVLDIKKSTKSKTEEQSELSGSENPDDLDGLFGEVSGEVVDHDEPKLTVQTDINCCPGELRLEYEETRYSSYSEVIMRSVSGSIKECYYQHSFIEPEILGTPLKEYCPLEMGPFHLLRVSKGNLQYLDVVSELSEENPEIEVLREIYPQATEDGKLILHPPSQLWGFDGARLIVVVIASCHGDPNTNYIWNKDGKPHKEGSSLASICIDEPGRYYVEVFNGENKEASEQFDVVALGTASPTLLQTPESTTFSESTLMPDTLPVIDSAELSLGKQIGSGAFGVVYTATWAGTPVAVKAIKVRNAKRLSSTLENEIKVHNTLRHPNIVQMMGVSYLKNSIYIVSEFIKGKNLDDILFDDTDKSSSLNDYTRLSINQQLCRAIAYLHHKKPQIIHRDIKPANVLVNTESFLTKLCDMGISKFKSSLTTTATTNTVSLPGTPQYMAPECLLSNKSGNAASDIWSLGCTLVECFNGEDLWGSELEEHTDDDPVTALRNILRAAQPPKAVSMLKDTIPAAIKLVLAKCFYFDAPKRPSAIDVLDAFNGDH